MMLFQMGGAIAVPQKKKKEADWEDSTKTAIPGPQPAEEKKDTAKAVMIKNTVPVKIGRTAQDKVQQKTKTQKPEETPPKTAADSAAALKSEVKKEMKNRTPNTFVRAPCNSRERGGKLADYAQALQNTLLSDENAKNKIDEITEFYFERPELLSAPYNVHGGWAIGKSQEVMDQVRDLDLKEYRTRMAEAVCTQLGHKNKTVYSEGKEAFLGCSDQTFELLALGLRAERIAPLFLGNEKQVTLLRNNAGCEDKIGFLLRLRKEYNKAKSDEGQKATIEIDKLIDGQLQYIQNHYNANGTIRGKSRNGYVKWVMEQMK